MEKQKLDREKLSAVCDEDIIYTIAEKIESFERTSKALGFSGPKRQEIKDNYSDAMMRKVRLLEVWKRSQGSDATYLALVEALLKVDERETAEYIVTHVKQLTHVPPPGNSILHICMYHNTVEPAYVTTRI